MTRPDPVPDAVARRIPEVRARLDAYHARGWRPGPSNDADALRIARAEQAEADAADPRLLPRLRVAA